MSYKQCFFGVPAEAPMSSWLAEFRELATELRMENGYASVHLVTSSDEDARGAGIRLLCLGVSPSPEGRVSRDFFIERWTEGSLFVIAYDDQHGLCLFEHV